MPSIYTSMPPGGYRRAITIDNRGLLPQSNFPVLINLSAYNFGSANLYNSFAKSDGADVHFASDLLGATPIDYHRERWDITNQIGRLWVKIANLPNGLHTVYMFYGQEGAADVSNGSGVFTFYDDFPGGAVQQHLFGSDAAMSCCFIPELRRIYFFGQDQESSTGADLVQWMNIDNGDLGLVKVLPGTDYTPVNSAGICYHADEEVIFIYGGRLTADASRTDLVQSFNPFTETFATLGATFPTELNSFDAVLDPASGDVFTFGGRAGSGVVTNTDAIYRHDVSAGTITDTGADLPTAATAVGAVYFPDDGKIYLFGGVWTNGGDDDNLDTILAYDPATPGTNPVDTGDTLDRPTENQHGVAVGDAIYLFGGHDYQFHDPGDSAYHDIIQKYVPSTGARTTLAATLPRADDDMRAFYDPVTELVYVSAALHSDEPTDNKFHHKVVVLEFDPSTEDAPIEPALRFDPPPGWNSIGTYSGDEERNAYHTSHYLVIDDDDNAPGSFIRAEKVITGISSGLYALEAYVDAVTPAGDGAINLVEGSTTIAQLRANGGPTWAVTYGASGLIQDVADWERGWQVLGLYIDFTNARQYGEVDRATRSGALALRNALSSAVDRIWINSSAGGTEHMVIDWVQLRKAALVDPIVTVGPEVAL